MSKRLTVDLLGCLHGIPISLGSITACEERASRAVANPVADAHRYVREQLVKHADETSWHEGPSRSPVWLWVGLTAQVTVFLIRASRGAEVARELLGTSRGVLVSDRWTGYNWWPTAGRQLCWAHIKRHFQDFVDSQSPEAQRVGHVLLRHQKEMFKHWRRVRDGTLSRPTFRQYVVPIRRKIRKLLDQGRTSLHAKTAGTCRELLALESAMWTFVRKEGVEPTNNPAERAVRPGVILRKLTFGTHSSTGSRYIERMLSLLYTLKQQGRDAMAFITQCVTDSMSGVQTTASLLPEGP
jgi:transposase